MVLACPASDLRAKARKDRDCFSQLVPRDGQIIALQECGVNAGRMPRLVTEDDGYSAQVEAQFDFSTC